MFKKLSNRKIFSVLLALVLVFGMSVSGFAEGMLKNYIPRPQMMREAGSPGLNLTMPGNPTIVENPQEVGGVTRYTKFAQYPSSSTQDLASVSTTVSFLGADKVAVIAGLDPNDPILNPSGTITPSDLSSAGAVLLNNSGTATVNFTGAPVAFVLLNNASGGNYTYVRNYWVSAGKLGDTIYLRFKVNVENVVKWLNGEYSSNNPMFAGKVPTKSATNANLVEARFRDAMGLPSTGPVDEEDANYINLIIETEVGKTVQEAMTSGTYYLADESDIAAGMGGSFFTGLSSGYVSEIKKYPLATNPVTIPHLIFTEYGVPIGQGGYDDFDGTGWMYKVNGYVADRGINQYYLTTFEDFNQNPVLGTGIEWGYTFDWGVDVGGPVW